MDKRVRHTPLSKHEAYRRLNVLKRGFGLTTVIGFGVLGALTFPHGIQTPTSQAPGTLPAAGTNPAASGNGGSATSPAGGDAIGGFFSAVGSALFGNDGQGQDQTGQGGYGFGPTNSGGAPATGSGVS